MLYCELMYENATKQVDKTVTTNKEYEAPLVHQVDHTAQSSPTKQTRRKSDKMFA